MKKSKNMNANHYNLRYCFIKFRFYLNYVVFSLLKKLQISKKEMELKIFHGKRPNPS